MNALVNFEDIDQTATPGRHIHVGPRGGTTPRPPQKVSHTYMKIADLMLSEDRITMGDLAKRLKYSQAWLSMIVHSDSYKAYFAQRRQEFNEALAERISGKLGQATEAALDSLIEGIATKGAALPVLERKEVVDTLLTRMGYGGKSSSAVNVSVNNQVNSQVVAVERNVLVEARASLRAVEELHLARARGVLIEPQPEGGEDNTASRVLTEGEDSSLEILKFNVE